MNSVPETVFTSNILNKRMPFSIEQSNYSDGIYFFGFGLDSPITDRFTVAIFRVYPKGKNPMSIKRKDKFFNDHIDDMYKRAYRPVEIK